MVLNVLALARAARADGLAAAGGRACIARCGCCRCCSSWAPAGVAVGGGLAAALLLKGADGTLRHSLHRTGTELLFLPIPDALRARVKPVIDVFGQRGGQAIASVFILGRAGAAARRRGARRGRGALCIVWVAWAADLRPPLPPAVPRGAARGHDPGRAAACPSSTWLARGAVRRPQQPRRRRGDGARWTCSRPRAACGLIPALILYHPSQRRRAARARASSRAAGRTDFVPLADRLLEQPGPRDPRGGAAGAHGGRSRTSACCARRCEDPSPLVRATAAGGPRLGRLGHRRGADDARRAARAADSPRGAARARARDRSASRRRPSRTCCCALAATPGRRRAGARWRIAMAALRERALPAHPARDARAPRGARRPRARRSVRSARGRSQFLDEALADPSFPHELRRHLPRTISRFPPKEAAAVLHATCSTSTDGMVRFKILRGLGRLAADHPDSRSTAASCGRRRERTLEAGVPAGALAADAGRTAPRPTRRA